MTTRKSISYGRQDITDADIRAVVDCLKGDFLTQGPRVAAFEAALTEATGAKYAVAVANGTAALHIAYAALGVGPDDTGLTSPISFVATANGLLYNGARVEFADVDPATGNIRVDEVERAADRLAAAGRSPKVITPVDLAGQPTDRAGILAVAKKHGAKILEDSAHSLGATYDVDGKTFKVGSCAHADAAILSFHPVKHVTTGEGGAILTNDAEVYRALCDLRTHGIHKDPKRLARPADDAWAGPWYYEQSALGFNYRITDMQCALGASQMTRLSAYVARRQEIAAHYDAALASGPLADFLQRAELRAGRTHAYHLYVVQVRPRRDEDVMSIARRRKELYLRLAGGGIHCQVHYIPIPWQPFYKDNPRVGQGTFPGAERYYAASLSIPMFPAMTDTDVDDVIRALEAACTGR